MSDVISGRWALPVIKRNEITTPAPFVQPMIAELAKYRHRRVIFTSHGRSDHKARRRRLFSYRIRYYKVWVKLSQAVRRRQHLITHLLLELRNKNESPRVHWILLSL